MRKLAMLAASALLAGGTEVPGAANADSVNWEAIAKCESGGNWSANTGNGDYGGLQITASTWDANGGVGLPSQASPEEQIAVAKRIMATQGPGAWPTCSSRGAIPSNGDEGAPPVGSLTYYLQTLIDEAEGINPQ